MRLWLSLHAPRPYRIASQSQQDREGVKRGIAPRGRPSFRGTPTCELGGPQTRVDRARVTCSRRPPLPPCRQRTAQVLGQRAIRRQAPAQHPSPTCRTQTCVSAPVRAALVLLDDRVGWPAGRDLAKARGRSPSIPSAPAGHPAFPALKGSWGHAHSAKCRRSTDRASIPTGRYWPSAQARAQQASKPLNALLTGSRDIKTATAAGTADRSTPPRAAWRRKAAIASRSTARQANSA